MRDPDDREQKVSDALRRVGAAEKDWGASPAVEARLIAEVRSIARARRRRSTFAALAMAAAVVLVVTASLWRPWERPETAAPVYTGPAARSGEAATGFIPLMYSRVPTATTQIVRMQVPRQALAAFGLASFDQLDQRAGATVTADVLIGEDGLARAVRFVLANRQ